MALTRFGPDLIDEWLAPHGVQVISTRDPVAPQRAGFDRPIVVLSRARGVLLDYREPDSIQMGQHLVHLA